VYRYLKNLKENVRAFGNVIKCKKQPAFMSFINTFDLTPKHISK